jgi:cytochrome c
MKAGTLSLIMGLAMEVFGSVQAQDLEAGRKLFVNACATCHAVEPGGPARQGPNLRGVVGRASASLPDFKYTEALKRAGWVWDEQRLDQWLANAQEALPGTTMLYRQANGDRRQLVIAYLKSLSQ